ncbi:MAG: hypothetical protein GXP22_08650 [Gammaproteobacteria bacterium]|nr:hypothetical protein [Gammaproteobacteria bacterium]
MDWWLLSKTRCEYIPVSSTAASMRLTVFDKSHQPMSFMIGGMAYNVSE